MNEPKRKTGMSCSTNFVLDKKITSLDQLGKLLNNKKSMYCSPLIYATSFIRNWQIDRLMILLEQGMLWTIKPKK